MLCLLVASLLSFSEGLMLNSPPVQLYEGYNVISHSVGPHQSAGPIHYLGTVNETEDCLSKCLTLTSGQCKAFTYHTLTFDPSMAGQCFGIVDDPIWSPVKEDRIVSGRILWPCQDNMDCSLNGKCLPNGKCLCRKAWTGPRCGQLQLLPASRDSGYHFQQDGRNISSWGGAVLHWEQDNTYHMYLAEMRNHCGINSWFLNSQVVHAMSNSADGPYKRVNVIRQPFAHEPDAIRGSSGEFVLYWSENHYELPLCNCTDGSTSPDCKTPVAPMYYTYMSYASAPHGPWSSPVAVLGPKRSMDTNFAPVILRNGSLIGFSRFTTGSPQPFIGSRMHLVTASNWKDPSTYIEHKSDVFPYAWYMGMEDPFLYEDEDGYFHALFHNMVPSFMLETCGGHAFSKDGLHWLFGGASYNNIVHFTDGGSFAYSRRERPHFVFDADGFTPVALTCGAQYGGMYKDATYTLLQPVAH